MSYIQLDIVSAEASLFSGKVRRVFVRGVMGELGITPGHAPLLTALQPGQLRLECMPGKDVADIQTVFYVSGGMLEVQPHYVTVLADTALRAQDLDEAAAQAAKEKAEKALLEKQTDLDYSQTLAHLAEAVAQLNTLRELRRLSKK